jgi:hypothetical protein
VAEGQTPRTPKIGDVVQYTPHADGVAYGAVIGTVDHPDNPRSSVGLCAFVPEPYARRGVPYSETPEPGKWSWRDAGST